MRAWRNSRIAASAIVLVWLAGCGTPAPTPVSAPARPAPPSPRPTQPGLGLIAPEHANEIVLFSLNLLDTGYLFGGRNPEAGLDCSGMVSYVVEQVAGKRLPHNAAQIAAITQPVDRDRLQAADLVFFNTTGQPYSHMGIYIGDGRFIHAPSTKGRVRIERMDAPYFAARFTGARTLF